MIKWAIITQHETPMRYQYFSDILRSFKIANEYEFIKPPQDKFLISLQEAQKKCAFLRVESPYSETAVDLLHKLPQFVEQLRCIDVMQKEGSEWWGRCYLYEGLYRLIALRRLKVDSSQPAFIIGIGAAAKVTISLLIRLGYKKISIVDKNYDYLLQEITKLKRKYFGIEFIPVRADDVIKLKGESTFVAKCLHLTTEDPFYEMLHYLNFLNPGGILIDLSADIGDTSFVVEGKVLGAQILAGIEIACSTDALFLESYFKKTVSIDDYLQKYRTFVALQKKSPHVK